MGVLITALTFLVVVSVTLGLWIFASSDSNQELIRKRMSAVHKAERRGEVSLNLKLVSDEMMSSVPVLHRFLMQCSLPTKLQDFLVQAGLTMKRAKLILLSAVAGSVSYLLSGFLYANFYISLPICFASSFIRLVIALCNIQR